MANPYHHAVSSVKHFGGEWEDYLPLHSWFDASKGDFAKITHRALRHHDFGIAEAVQLFGPGCGQALTSQIGRQHVEEDCGFVPTVEDWVRHIDLTKTPAVRNPLIPPDRSARRFGGVAEDYAELHGWFALGWRSQCGLLRLHSRGIFDSEARFGPVIRRADGRMIPTRWVAEYYVSEACVDGIPTLADWVAHITYQPWMIKGARALSAELGV